MDAEAGAHQLTGALEYLRNTVAEVMSSASHLKPVGTLSKWFSSLREWKKFGTTGAWLANTPHGRPGSLPGTLFKMDQHHFGAPDQTAFPAGKLAAPCGEGSVPGSDEGAASPAPFSVRRLLRLTTAEEKRPLGIQEPVSGASCPSEASLLVCSSGDMRPGPSDGTSSFSKAHLAVIFLFTLSIVFIGLFFGLSGAVEGQGTTAQYGRDPEILTVAPEEDASAGDQGSPPAPTAVPVLPGNPNRHLVPEWDELTAATEAYALVPSTGGNNTGFGE